MRLGKVRVRGPRPLVVGDGVVIGAQAIVVRRARSSGTACIVGDQAYVRERARDRARGRWSAAAARVDNDVVIGARVSIQTGVLRHRRSA